MTAAPQDAATPAPRERGILFSAPMVRALLSGAKTQTRRLVKPQPPTVEAVKAKAGIDYLWFTDDRSSGRFRVAGPVWAVRECGGPESIACPYGKPGDRLWVRETWRCDGLPTKPGETARLHYRADQQQETDGFTWKPGIHMFRWASRIMLEITDIRVQRLWDIDDAAARAEGVEPVVQPPTWSCMRKDGSAFDCHFEPTDEDMAELVAVVPRPARELLSPRQAFAVLWESINGARASWLSNPWVWALTFRRLP